MIPQKLKINRVINEIPLPDRMLAKTIKFQQTKIGGASVEDHCLLVGRCALYLTRDIMHQSPKLFGCKTWNEVACIAALHDVGKCSPGFQQKIYDDLGIQLDGLPKYDKNNTDYVTNHALVSQLELRDMAFYRTANIAGIHHGYRDNLSGQDASLVKYGTQNWRDYRKNLINKIIKYFGVDPVDLINYDVIKFTFLENQYHVDLGEYRLTAVCVISDWIASDAFGNDIDCNYITSNDIASAFEDRGFVGFKVNPRRSFTDIFSVYKIINGVNTLCTYEPRTIQREFTQFIDKHGVGKVYVLEDQMGNGKTETALFAAYSLLKNNLANGIIFALPTRATANQMLSRFNGYLSNIVDDKTKHHVAKLIHGSARLYQNYNETDAPGSTFYTNNVKSMLLPFQITTIDQIIMSSMNTKFAGVRAYGLMGKVIIIDEAHSTDAYTSTHIQGLIRICVESGATIILLSATLSNAALSRYAMTDNVGINNSFPRMSIIDYNKTGRSRIRFKKSKSIVAEKKIKIQYGTTRVNALEQAYNSYLQGGQVAWVDNTVDHAHDVYKWFINRGVCVDNIVCLSSRNTDGWRRDNELKWCDLLGNTDKSDRSIGRIVVGTQVIEQSLNIDFDIMFSLLAYSDNMLQRMGRLMRFNNIKRNAQFTQPLFVVVYPTENFGEICDECMSKRNRVLDDYDIQCMVNELNDALDKTKYVYKHTIFLMTTHRLWKKINSISLPRDIRHIINYTYDHRSELGVYGWLQKKYEHAINDMERKAYQKGVVTNAITQTLSRGHTRIQEDEDKIRVLILKEPPCGDIITLNDKYDLDSDIINLSEYDSYPYSKKIKYQMAIELNMVSVPAKIAPPGTYADIKCLVDRKIVYSGNVDNDDHIDEPLARIAILRNGIVYDIKMRPLAIPCGLDKNIGYYRL